MEKAPKQSIKQLLQTNSQLLNRLALQSATGVQFGGKRDLYEVLGYNKNPQFADYVSRFYRQDIAKRIISAYPDAIWMQVPKIVEDDDVQNETEFEKQFSDFARRSRLFHYLNRLDKLVGLGRYAVLLLGVQDGKNLEVPLTSLSSLEDIIYLMPFGEKNATIQKFDEDIRSERYGMPDMYKVQVGGYSGGNSTMPNKTVNVHHSRLIHVAEGTLENDVFGTPRLECVINRLDDLDKVVGGSAEIFWLNGRGGINLNADKDAEIRDPETLKEEAENYVHQLTRVLRTKGMQINTLELEVSPPEQHVSVIMDLVASATGIPKRILLGSERGELASSQDEANWLFRVQERRENFCEPQMLRAIIKRFMDLGAMNEVDDYEIVWPELESIGPSKKSEIAVRISQALNAYVNSHGSDLIIPPKQFVEEILGQEYREQDIEEELKSERHQMEEDKLAMEEAAKQQKVAGGQDPNAKAKPKPDNKKPEPKKPAGGSKK